MKASELAAQLMKTPNAEVYLEIYDAPEFDDGGYHTEKASGVEKTPDGIFITTNYSEDYPKAPSDKPKINTIAIMMKDGKWFKQRLDDHDISALRDYDENGYICSYIGWHDDYYVLAPSDIEDGWVKDNIAKIGSTHYTPDDVDYVQILVGLDDDTWTPVYQKFTLDEAVRYAKGEL